MCHPLQSYLCISKTLLPFCQHPLPGAPLFLLNSHFNSQTLNIFDVHLLTVCPFTYQNEYAAKVNYFQQTP